MDTGTTTFFDGNLAALIYWDSVGDCSALATASVTLDMYPSDPSCPPTEAEVKLLIETPSGVEITLDTHTIRAPPYTLPSCSGNEYPMRMNVALVGRVILRATWDPSSGDEDYYNFKVRVSYVSDGVDGVYSPSGRASMIIWLEPCEGVQPI
jgi:hypothetical protein